MSDLGSHLEEALAPEPADRFVVDNDSKANWAMLKLARVSAQIEDARRQAAHYRRLIEDWLTSVVDPLESDAAYFARLLMEYLRRLREADERDEDKKIKSHKLPTGTISSTAGGRKIEVTNQSAFVSWAIDSERLELLTIRPSVERIKAAINTLYRVHGETLIYGDGEVVPGLRVYDADRTYRATPAELPALPSQPLGSLESSNREETS